MLASLVRRTLVFGTVLALKDGEQPYVLNAPLPDDLRSVLDRLKGP